MKRNSIALIALVVMLIISCKHSPDTSSYPEISYSKRIEPIIINNCTQSGCHDGSGSGEEDAEALTNYNQIVDNIRPGNPDQSELYRVIVNGSMPPGGPLTDQQIKLIYLWISQGAKNN